MMRHLATLAIVLLLPSLASAAELVEVLQRWDGKVMDAKPRELAPEHCFVVDQQQLEKIWKAWRNDEAPQLDFNRSLVLVGTVPGPNKLVVKPTLTDGNLRFLVGGTKIGGPGFGYVLLHVPRAGVQSVNGTLLQADQPVEAAEYVHVEVKGKLQTGIFAIGGETTGTTITAKNITWELDFGNNEKLAAATEKLDGKTVVVRGELEKKAGVEITERWIVRVRSLKAAAR